MNLNRERSNQLSDSSYDVLGAGRNETVYLSMLLPSVDLYSKEMLWFMNHSDKRVHCSFYFLIIIMKVEIIAESNGCQGTLILKI